MTVMEFAKGELDILMENADGDVKEKQEEANGHIVEILELIAKQKHTVLSVSYTFNILKRLLALKPLSPLIGEDSEWEQQDDGSYKNVRCPSVMRYGILGAYKYQDTEAYLFCEPNSSKWFLSNESVKDIEFPYMPKRSYVLLKYPKEEVPIKEQLLKGDCVIKGE